MVKTATWPRQSVLTVLLATVFVGGGTIAVADDGASTAYWELPGIACEDIYVPSGGVLSYQDNGATFTECAFDTPQGVVVYYWFYSPFGSESREYWGLRTQEEAIPDLFGFSAVQEAFGTFYEQDRDASDAWMFTGSTRDTGSPRWGVTIKNRAEFGGSPEAISRMLDITAERVASLEAALAEEEDPNLNRQFWTDGVLDCQDVWDGAGLDPAFEVVTLERFDERLSCGVIEVGRNPFARDTEVFLRFSFLKLNCQDDRESLAFFEEWYTLQKEESFGLFRFRQEPSAIPVAGETTDLQGIYIDQDACVVFEGWPEIIERMVAALPASQQRGEAIAESQVVGPDRVSYSLPSTLSLSSLVGAVSAIVLVAALSLLRPMLTGAKVSAPARQTDPIRVRQGRKRLGARVGIVLAVSVAVALAVLVSDPPLRALFAAGQFGYDGLLGFFALWGMALLVATALAVTIVVSLSAPGPLVSAPFALWALLASGWAIVSNFLDPSSIPLVPMLAVLLVAASYGALSPGNRRPTLVIWLGVLVSLAIMTVVGVEALMAVTPEWARQAVLVVLAVLASSSAVLAIPVAGGPGRAAYQSHPVMWASAMALSWWAFVTVGGLSWQLTGIYGAVSVVAVVISGLWSRRKRTATPVHQNTGVSDT